MIMLDHISLLPPEYFEIKRRKSRNKKLLIVFSALFIITFTAFVVLTIIVSGIKSELNVVEERLEYVKEKIEEHKEFEGQQQEIEIMEQVIKESIGYNPGLPNIIKEIGKTVPEEVSFKAILAKYDYNKSKSNEEVEEAGDAEEQEVSPGIAAISIKSALYGNPEVLNIWANQIEKIDKVREVQFRYAPTTEPDSLGRFPYEVEMSILIKIDEPYRYFGGDSNE